MGKLRANSEIISDKSKNPVTTSTYIKHGNQWLDDAVNNAIGAAASKADKTYVDSELTKKANKSDTDAALSSKADKSALEATNASVSANTSNIQELSTESTVLSARMDEFTKLKEGSTTGDAELADGRVGADGKTYDNIGGAIRGQVTDLKSDLSDITNCQLLNSIKNYGVDLTTNPVNITPVFEDSYECYVENCVEGDTFTLNGKGGSRTRLWAFLDSNNNVISVSDASLLQNNLIIVTAPQNATTFVCNSAYGIFGYNKCYKGVNGSTTYKSVIKVDKKIGVLKEEINHIHTINLHNVETDINNYTLNPLNGEPVTHSSSVISDFIKVESTQTYYRTLLDKTGNDCYYDENKKFVRALTDSELRAQYIVIPDGVSYIRMSRWNTQMANLGFYETEITEYLSLIHI